MKTKILFISFLFWANYSFSQLAVSDAGATTAAQQTATTTYSTLVKTGTLVTKTKVMLDNIKHMKEQYDSMMKKIEEVNSAIATGQQIKKIISSIGDVQKSYETTMNYVNSEKIIQPEEKIKFNIVLMKMVNKTLDDLESALKITTNGSYNMTDAERLEFLNGISAKIEHQNNLINYFFNKIKSSATKQKMKNKDSEFIRKAHQSFKK